MRATALRLRAASCLRQAAGSTAWGWRPGIAVCETAARSGRPQWRKAQWRALGRSWLHPSGRSRLPLPNQPATLWKFFAPAVAPSSKFDTRRATAMHAARSRSLDGKICTTDACAQRQSARFGPDTANSPRTLRDRVAWDQPTPSAGSAVGECMCRTRDVDRAGCTACGLREGGVGRAAAPRRRVRAGKRRTRVIRTRSLARCC